MEHLFSAIRQSKVSEEIVNQIKSLIKNGQLKPGEKLPSERRLSVILEVGRSTVREAINSLSMTGLVEAKNRKGIYVGTIGAPLVTDPLKELMADDIQTINHLYDIRIDIETASAREAATNRNDTDLADIHQCLINMREKQGTYLYSIDEDLELHIAIAHATGNYLRVHIIKNIFDLTDEFIQKALLKITSEQANIETLFRQHKRVHDAIAARQSEQAAEAMRHHLKWVKSQIDAYH
jgi:GntR family transcriptional repressor for pyruvate dehydrogenase complex